MPPNLNNTLYANLLRQEEARAQQLQQQGMQSYAEQDALNSANQQKSLDALAGMANTRIGWMEKQKKHAQEEGRVAGATGRPMPMYNEEVLNVYAEQGYSLGANEKAKIDDEKLRYETQIAENNRRYQEQFDYRKEEDSKRDRQHQQGQKRIAAAEQQKQKSERAERRLRDTYREIDNGYWVMREKLDKDGFTIEGDDGNLVMEQVQMRYSEGKKLELKKTAYDNYLTDIGLLSPVTDDDDDNSSGSGNEPVTQGTGPLLDPSLPPDKPQFIGEGQGALMEPDLNLKAGIRTPPPEREMATHMAPPPDVNFDAGAIARKLHNFLSGKPPEQRQAIKEEALQSLDPQFLQSLPPETQEEVLTSFEKQEPEGLTTWETLFPDEAAAEPPPTTEEAMQNRMPPNELETLALAQEQSRGRRALEDSRVAKMEGKMNQLDPSGSDGLAGGWTLEGALRGSPGGFTMPETNIEGQSMAQLESLVAPPSQSEAPKTAEQISHLITRITGDTTIIPEKKRELVGQLLAQAQQAGYTEILENPQLTDLIWL